MAKNIKITSPKGTAKYPWLNKADTKYHKDGEYKVSLSLPKKEAEPFLKTIKGHLDAWIKANEPKAKKRSPLPWAEETDDQDNATGNVVIRFKSKNKINKEGELWDRKPALFDAKGNKINVQVGGGSTIRVSCELYFWNSAKDGPGVTLQIAAVQVLELVERETGSAKSYGFEEEEGFTAESDGAEAFNGVEEQEVSSEGSDEDLY
jgi:hypothetical protein